MSTRKMTRTEAIALAQHQDRAVNVLNVALNALVDGTCSVKFKAGPHTLRIAGPNRADGGIVIHTYKVVGQNGYTVAQYWDDWWPAIRAMSAPDGLQAVQLRDAAYLAHDWIIKQQQQKEQK